MSKGPRIKPTVKRVIVWEALKDRNKPRRQLVVELIDIIEGMGEIAPAEETLEKLISRARNHPVSPLDAPFSLASLAEYNIPPEAMPTIIWVYKQMFRESPQHFTIRQALWVARLHSIIESSDVVRGWADTYAFREQVCWILGEPFFTRDIDVSLIQSIYYSRKPNRFPGHLAFPFGESEEWEQRLKQKGYTLEPSPDDISDEERQFEAKYKKISEEIEKTA